MQVVRKKARPGVADPREAQTTMGKGKKRKSDAVAEAEPAVALGKSSPSAELL